jgi:starch synthase
MRVAYICADPGVPVFGTKGSSVHVQEIVRAWRRAGADVTVYCTRAGTDRPADLAWLPVVEIPPHRAEGAGPASGEERERAIGEAAVPWRRPWSGTAATWSMNATRCSARPWPWPPAPYGSQAVLEVNAPLIEEQQQYRQLHDRRLAQGCSAQRLAADTVACVSEPVVRWVERRVPGAKTLLAPNGVNTERIGPRPAGGATRAT